MGRVLTGLLFLFLSVSVTKAQVRVNYPIQGLPHTATFGPTIGLPQSRLLQFNPALTSGSRFQVGSGLNSVSSFNSIPVFWGGYPIGGVGGVRYAYSSFGYRFPVSIYSGGFRTQRRWSGFYPTATLFSFYSSSLRYPSSAYFGAYPYSPYYGVGQLDSPLLRPVVRPDAERERDVLELRGEVREPDPDRAVPGMFGVADAIVAEPLRRSSVADMRAAFRSVSRGDRYFRDGRFLEAQSFYRSAIRKADELALPHARHGMASVARGDFVEAAGQLKKAADYDPEMVVEEIRLTELIEAADPQREAWLEQLSAAALDQPNDHGLLFVIGFWLLIDDQPDRAELFLTKSQDSLVYRTTSQGLLDVAKERIEAARLSREVLADRMPQPFRLVGEVPLPDQQFDH